MYMTIFRVSTERGEVLRGLRQDEISFAASRRRFGEDQGLEKLEEADLDAAEVFIGLKVADGDERAAGVPDEDQRFNHEPRLLL
jgi:hypothetical protein